MYEKQLTSAMAQIHRDVLAHKSNGTVLFLALSILLSGSCLLGMLPMEIRAAGVLVVSFVLVLIPLGVCTIALEDSPLNDKHLEILASAGVQDGPEGEFLKNTLRTDGKLYYEDLKKALNRMRAKPEPTIGKQRFLQTAV